MATNIVIRYITRPGWRGEKLETQPIAGWLFSSQGVWHSANKQPDGTNGSIKCIRCGTNSWTENGRSMNEYECDSCGEFVLTEPKNHA